VVRFEQEWLIEDVAMSEKHVQAAVAIEVHELNAGAAIGRVRSRINGFSFRRGRSLNQLSDRLSSRLKPPWSKQRRREQLDQHL
jgi:hypothetical protein